jgi:hypothetical protein
MDYIRQLLAFRYVYINGSMRKWRNVEIEDRPEDGSVLSQFGLIAMPVDPDPIPDPEKLVATFMVLEEPNSYWEISWTRIRAAFGSHPVPLWLKARRTVHHVNDLAIKPEHPEPNARLTKIMRDRQEFFDWQGHDVTCSLPSLAEMTVSFIASVGKTYLELRSNVQDNGRLEDTKRKAIEHLLGRSTADPDVVRSYMEMDPDDDRVPSESGSELLSGHPQLTTEVGNQIMSMSLHPGFDFATDMTSCLESILDSTVQPYFLKKMSNANLVKAMQTLGSGDSPLGRSVLKEIERRGGGTSNRTNSTDLISSLSGSQGSVSEQPRSISIGNEQENDGSHQDGAT